MLILCVDHHLPTMSTSDGSASILLVRFQYRLINGLRDAGLARRTADVVVRCRGRQKASGGFFVLGGRAIVPGMSPVERNGGTGRMEMPLLYRTWKRFVREGTLDAHRVSRDVSESWVRSRRYGVDPYRDRGDIVLEPEDLELQRHKYADVIREVESLVHKIHGLLMEQRMVALFCDADGRILSEIGHPDTLRRAREIQFVPGADWSEAAVGTNAIGTALEVGNAVYVAGYEHYVVATHPWCCAAVPLRDPKGNVFGVLNLSGPLESAHPYLLGVVATMGAHVEDVIARMPQQGGETVETQEGGVDFEGMIGKSASFRRCIDLAERAARVDYPVCLLGETGTGKELLARWIHRRSGRRGGPFVALNCGAMPEHLLESELFGHEEGAFTGAKKGGYPGAFRLAEGGTLFLDEVGEMPPQMQLALLRVLEEKAVRPIGGREEIRVNVRLVSATHRDLGLLVRQGAFREDLFHRLHVLPIHVPPLRERKEDIPDLAQYLLDTTGTGKKLNPAALRLLQDYPWRGNIRELRNVMVCASVFDDSRIIGPEGLTSFLDAENITGAMPGRNIPSRKEAVVDALQNTRGNVSAAARRLGVSRSTLYRWLKQGGTGWDR
ncbi:sigma-54-dependent Fis family transcriptional regulator [Kyrpidia spormannii]|uniref:Sigma-54-dependent Fis family transcriptional regulator n=1 Tax=Kyrpidia spormannii TaxID=2055160 RepID=A0A2K8N885_9BACL|nr:sigma-54-dependent Fis family transcriptional regulator [Kyrpidia spormannii]